MSLLSQSVQDDSVRRLVNEVINAMNGGARRSALVSLWVAVIVDLMNKTRDLAEGGDGQARKFMDDVDSSVEQDEIKEFLRYESELVDFAERKLEILDRQEAVQLKRIQADRNLCAHPSFSAESKLFSPTVEEIRAHLVVAHDAVFSKSAVAGKRRIGMLLNDLQGKGWPLRSRLGDYLSDRYFEGASDSARLNMWKLLIKSAIIPPEESDAPLKVATRARNAATIWREHDPSGFRDALAAVLQSWERSDRLTEEALARVVGAFSWCSEFEEAIPGTVLDRALAYIRRATTDELVEYRFFVGYEPINSDLLRRYEEARDLMKMEHLERALRYTHVRSPFISLAIDLIGESESFADAPRRLSLLEKISAHMGAGDVRDLEEKIVNNEGDQIRPARDVEEALIDAFNLADLESREVHDAWVHLANTLANTTSSDRYYGNSSGAPYAQLVDLVNQ